MGLSPEILKQLLTVVPRATVPRIILQNQFDLHRAKSSLMNCCMWRSGTCAKGRWSTSLQGVHVEGLLYTWDTVLEEALSGAAVDIFLDEKMELSLLPPGHSDWEKVYPYLRPTKAYRPRRKFHVKTKAS